MGVVVFLEDEMHAVVLASGEVMDDFGLVLAPVEVEDKFFLSEDMALVEGTTGLFLFGQLVAEHFLLLLW